MRHLKKKKIGKGTDHKRKLLRSLASNLILYEKIQTSHNNARAAKAYVEKAITESKSNSLSARRRLLAKLLPLAAKKAIEVLGPKYKSRPGGYTRLVKLTGSQSAVSKAMLELVE